MHDYVCVSAKTHEGHKNKCTSLNRIKQRIERELVSLLFLENHSLKKDIHKKK